MKKNIALFMAGALAMSTLPFNVFAASSNTVSNHFVSKSDVMFSSGAAYTDGDDKYVDLSEAPFLRFKLTHGLTAGKSFAIVLSEGEWAEDYSAETLMLTDDDTTLTYNTNEEDGLATEDYFKVTRESGEKLVIEIIKDVDEDFSLGVPVYGKLNGGKAITATVESGSTEITGGTTYSLTDDVDFDLTVESSEDRDLTIKEDIAGSLDVSETLKIEIRGSKAHWDFDGDVVLDGGSQFLTDEGRDDVNDDDVTVMLTNAEGEDSDIIEIALGSSYAIKSDGNETGLRGELELDLSDVLQITDRDYKGEIEVYVYGAGIDKSDKKTVVLYDNRLDVEAKVDEDLAELISGRVVQEASEVTLEELYDGSIRDDRYIKFELVNAEFAGEQTIAVSNADKDDVSVKPEEDAEGKFTQVFIDKNEFEFDQNEKNKITFTPEINIDAAVDGEITMLVSGPGIVGEYELVIAEAKAPITVETEITHIKAGFTNIPTADITIKENFVGALPEGKYVVTTAYTNSIGGIKVEEVKEEVIETEDFEVEVGVMNDELGFDVQMSSKDEPAEFTITGVEIYADSTVPTSKYAFELRIDGYSVEEFEMYDYSDISGDDEDYHYYGYEFEYMTTGNLDNEDNGQNNLSVAGLNKKVGITLGETAYTVEGTYQGELIAPAYVSNSGSTMIPVRALSYALGVSEDQIFWHQATQTVTIEVSKDRTAQFTLGSDLCTINGIQYPIISASGATDVVESKDGYTYLPLRFIGEKVFGVNVDWDNASQTATFN